MDTITQILHGRWAIQPEYARAAYPMIETLLEGRMVEWGSTASTSYQTVGEGGSLNSYRTMEEVPEGTILMLELKGPMMKDDQLCGPRGTAWLSQRIAQADESGKFEAIILSIDSPGGQVAGTEELARVVAQRATPVYSYAHTAASASYWVGAKGIELWLDGKTASVGSIGVVCSFLDVREAWEKRGLKLHEVYSKTSPDKNLAYRNALNGEYSELERELTRLDAIFMQSVRQSRPGIAEEALSGKMYLAEDAIRLGLADRIGSLAELVAHIRSNNYSFTNPQRNMTEEKQGGMLASFKSMFKSDSDVVQLKEEIEAKEAEVAQKAEELQAAQVRNRELEESSQKLAVQLAQAEQQRDEWKQKAEQYGKQPGSMATEPASPKPDGEAALPAWFDPEAEHNRTARAIQ